MRKGEADFSRHKIHDILMQQLLFVCLRERMRHGLSLRVIDVSAILPQRALAELAETFTKVRQIAGRIRVAALKGTLVAEDVLVNEPAQTIEFKQAVLQGSGCQQ